MRPTASSRSAPRNRRRSPSWATCTTANSSISNALLCLGSRSREGWWWATLPLGGSAWASSWSAIAHGSMTMLMKVLTHPGIADVAVVGAIDDESGEEVPKAFVVKQGDASLSEDESIDF